MPGLKLGFEGAAEAEALSLKHLQYDLHTNLMFCSE